MINRDDISHGTADADREFIFDALENAQIQAGLGMTFASIRDDVGLAHAMRGLITYVRAAAATLQDLRDRNDAGGDHEGS